MALQEALQAMSQLIPVNANNIESMNDGELPFLTRNARDKLQTFIADTGAISLPAIATEQYKYYIGSIFSDAGTSSWKLEGSFDMVAWKTLPLYSPDFKRPYPAAPISVTQNVELHLYSPITTPYIRLTNTALGAPTKITNMLTCRDVQINNQPALNADWTYYSPTGGIVNTTPVVITGSYSTSERPVLTNLTAYNTSTIDVELSITDTTFPTGVEIFRCVVPAGKEMPKFPAFNGIMGAYGGGTTLKATLSTTPTAGAVYITASGYTTK